MIITESRRDFRQRYRTCTVLVNKSIPFYIDDVDEDMCELIGSTITDDGNWRPTMYLVEDIEIDFKFPELGLLNAKKGVVRLSRYSAQQYRQSFNERCVNITQLNHDLQELFKLPIFNYEDLKHPKFIKDIFFPSYFTASGLISRSNHMYPTVDLFNGNNDLVDIILLEDIRIGGMLNAQR